MPADRRPTPPEREPLVYFGNWCGEGWSAGREGQSALTPADISKPAITVLNRHGRKRYSPVDDACKIHDGAYDRLAREPDGYRAALMKLEADRVLLATVTKLLREDQRGRGDLNMGEVLYARNVQIAFRTMLFFDGVAVARNLDSALRPQVRRVAREVAPYMLVLLGGPTMVPRLLRLRVQSRR